MKTFLIYRNFYLGLLFSILFAVFLRLHSDHIQIIKKTFELIHFGEWINYGNAATRVGFVPGSFLTAITTFPMMVFFTPYSSFFVIILFHLVSLYLLAKTGKLISKRFLITNILLFFWLNPWRVEQTELYNPAYIYLFSSLHLYTAISMRERSFWMTFFHVLSLGLLLQIHLSVLILVVLSGLLFVTKMIKIDWKGFVLSCLLIGISLLPWFLSYLSNEIPAPKSGDSEVYYGKNFVLVFPVFKAIFYWIRYGSTYFGRHIFSEVQFEWLGDGFFKTILHYFFHLLKWPIAILTVYLSTRTQWKKLSYVIKSKPFIREDRTSYIPQKWFIYYAFYLFLSMVFAAGLSPVEFNHWHLIVCFPAISLLIALEIDKTKIIFSLKPKTIKILLTIWFCAVCFFSSLGSRSHLYGQTFHSQFMKYYSHKKSLPQYNRKT